MAHFIRRPVSSTLLLTCGVMLATSCGRAVHDDHPGERPSPSAGETSQPLPGEAGGAASQAGAASGTPTSGSATSLAGAPATIDTTGVARSCTPSDAPGEPCEDARCWGTRCGVRFDLICKDGAWASSDSVLAWELSCPVPSDSVYDVGDIKHGACCGEVLPRNDVYTQPPSCNLCPQAAPQDGAPCSLPADCAPPIIDCFYKCCCYGNLTWAQCDGERWHVATNCSDK